MTRGSGRRRIGDEKRMMSFFTERIHLNNFILRDNRGKQAFAPWMALLKHRGVEEGSRYKCIKEGAREGTRERK